MINNKSLLAIDSEKLNDESVDYIGFFNIRDVHVEEAKADAQKMVEEERDKAIDMVISTIALNEGWEESGDKYRKMYGIPPVYERDVK